MNDETPGQKALRKLAEEIESGVDALIDHKNAHALKERLAGRINAAAEIRHLADRRDLFGCAYENDSTPAEVDLETWTSTMRGTDAIRADLRQARLDRVKIIRQSADLHHRTCKVLAEARDHPNLSMEDARREVGLPRVTAYEYARQAEERGEE